MCKKSVLVLEDMISLRKLYKYTLEPEFQVFVVKNKKQMAELLNKHSVNVMLLDYHIPGENFDDIIGFLENKHNDIPRILISTYVETYNLEEKYKGRVKHILDKPIDIGEFKELIKKVI